MAAAMRSIIDHINESMKKQKVEIARKYVMKLAGEVRREVIAKNPGLKDKHDQVAKETIKLFDGNLAKYKKRAEEIVKENKKE